MSIFSCTYTPLVCIIWSLICVKLLPIFNQYQFVCCLLSFESSLYTLDTNPLQRQDLKYFSQPVALHFFLLTTSFEEQKFLTLMKLQFIVFNQSCFGAVSKESLPNQDHKDFSLMFSSRSFKDLDITFCCMMHFLQFALMQCKTLIL